MTNPFKIDDKIFNTYNGQVAYVTELTERGFKYRLENHYPFIVREGSYFTGGEVFLDEHEKYNLKLEWEIYTGSNKLKPLEMYYEKGD